MAEAESDEISVNTDEMGDAQCEHPPCSAPRARTTTATTTATTTTTTTTTKAHLPLRRMLQGLAAQRCRRC